MSANNRQTRSQRLARKALDCVQRAASSKLADDYKPRAMSFPTLVLQSGLAQAVGFLSCKSSNEGIGQAYRQYFADLATVVGKESGKDLLQSAVNSPLAEYRMLTREVLDAALWLKRFSQSLIQKEGTHSGAGK